MLGGMPCTPPSRRRPPLAVLLVVLAVAAGGSVSDVPDEQAPSPVASAEPTGKRVSSPAASGEPPDEPLRRWLLEAEMIGVPHSVDASTVDALDPNEPAVMPPTHILDPGETMAEVAERYGLAVDELARANAVRDRRLVRPGRTLVLPRAEGNPPATPEQAMGTDLPARRLLDDTAAAFGLAPALVKAVAWRESRWNQRVVSSQGAIGVMQVRPVTGQVASEHVGRDLDLYDVEDNVTAGVAYLHLLRHRMGGDLSRALAAYYQGPRSVHEHGRFAVTEAYIADILALRERFTS